MQKLWSGIRSIINAGKCKNSYITSILNNKSVDNPNDIADCYSVNYLVMNNRNPIGTVRMCGYVI